jgi:hypothetical protein
MTTLFENEAPHPLADKLRPQRLADIVGQDHLLGPDGPIGGMVARRPHADDPAGPAWAHYHFRGQGNTSARFS